MHFHHLTVMMLLGGNGRRRKGGGKEEVRERTYPYATPAMVHFLNCITLQVRVPVLSEKMYFTCIEWEKELFVLSFTLKRRQMKQYIIYLA